jgi:hypothetical protein
LDTPLFSKGELDKKRNSFVAYLFLKRLKSLYGIRVVVAERTEPHGIAYALS